MTQAAPELGATLTGGYRLTRFLGQGAMGAVYEALDPQGGRVAIKVVLLEGNEQHAASLLARFEREARLVQAIDSPFVVKALHVGADDGTRMPFMVMPLLAGLDVEELILRDGAMHPTVVVRLALHAAHALKAAHDAGIVHRDIKPGNMFLDHDRQGRVTLRVLDFGLGKVAGDDEGLTKTGSVFGTPQYMAPEQFKDAKRVDARADLWGLGASLYHMLCGVGPYEHCSDMSELVVSVCRDDPRPLQEVAPWVDAGLAMVIHGLLLRDPEARCPSAQELVRALENFAAGSHEVWESWLVPLDEEIRAHAAQAVAVPTSWQLAAPQRSIPALHVEQDDVIGRRVGTGYTLLRRIGSGGMGAVYEAEGPDGGRYAVKVVRPDRAGASKSLLRRFVREANATQALDSPHVVRVIEAGSADDLPFIVMELMAGEDLSDTIARLGPLEPRHAARVDVQACEGLE
ncbi:MAG: protein kinase, partial [Polyangiaceae bacterium]